MAILPLDMSFFDWACAMISEYPNENLPNVNTNSDWQSYGNLLILQQAFSNVALPSTVGFSDWRLWAARFNEIIGA